LPRWQARALGGARAGTSNERGRSPSPRPSRAIAAKSIHLRLQTELRDAAITASASSR
jgi:hypothetical protein